MHDAYENDPFGEKLKMSIFSKIADMLFPPRCASCGEVTGGELPLCGDCFEKYSRESRRICTDCGKPASGCTCGGREIKTVFYLGYYPDSKRVTEKIIYVLKREKNGRLVDFFARDVAAKIMKYINTVGDEAEDYVVTFPPRSEEGLNKYGFDHAELLASRVAHYTGIPFCRALKRIGGMEQKKLSELGRAENARASLRIKNGEAVKCKKVLLVDDVMTTGATANIASELLYSAGALDVVPAVIAKTVSKKR